MKPRDYQKYAVDCVLGFDFQMGTRHPLVAAPTGVGKSVMIALLCMEIFARYGHAKIMILADVKELIDQNSKKIFQMWPTAPAGIYSAGLKRKDTKHPIIFGGIGSVANCPLYFGHVDFILVDEAHMISNKDSSQYREFINHIKTVNPFAVVVGFTATKWRMGQGLLTEGDNALFTDICCDMTTMEAFNWFLAEGYLCWLRPVRTEMEYDVQGVRTVAGEYHQGDLQKAVDKAELTERVVREAVRIGQSQNRKKWLVFASGVEHCIHVAEELERQGISVTYVHSNSKDRPMSDEERDRRIADFKAGKYQAMVNNGILTKGFDDPEIDYIIMLRKTKSTVLWVQMLGRGTRPYYMDGYDLSTKEGRLNAISNSEKPYCLVADFAGNSRELGTINDPRIPKPKGKKEPGDAPIRICPECGTYNHAGNSHCDFCGFEFPRVVQLEVKASKAELITAPKEPEPIQVVKFKVDRVEYVNHLKAGKPPSIRVTYYCGLRRFQEYVCLEHGGMVTGRSKRWWSNRSDIHPPESTIEALQYVEHLREPHTIHVRLDNELKNIINYEF